jgi:succinylglutamate desuccinylase
MMRISDCFSADYANARAAFREAAAAAGAALEAHHNPATVPTGTDLTCDTARLGPPEAERLLVVMAGTHGVEGFCGSGIEIGLLRSGFARQLPKGLGLLLIHAINPHGFAGLRRVCEGNIDLNRNFVDRGSPLPDNPGYRALRDAICPGEWTETARKVADAKLAAYGATHGAAALQAAIMSGQYVDPEGLFYGGREPCWSNRTLRRLLAQHGASVSQVAFIDLHTGLGPYGVGEIMNNHEPDHPGFRRIADWFAGEATSGEAGNSSSAPVMGDVTAAFDETLGEPAVSAITLEYGTVPIKDMVDALRGDNWLHVHGNPDGPEAATIKASIRDAFYPDRDDWKTMVWERGADVARRMMRGLAES